MEEELHTKRTLCEKLLEEGMVMVILDARSDEVEVPSHLKNDPQLRLNLSHRFENPLHLDNWGVKTTLSFAGANHRCSLPWDSIYVLFSHVGGDPYLFPEEVPVELLEELGVDPTDLDWMPSAPSSAPQFKVVSPVNKEEGNNATDPEPPAKPKTKRHLRVIK